MELVLLALLALAVAVLIKRKPGLLQGSLGAGPEVAPTFRHVTGTVTGLSSYTKNDPERTTEVSPDGLVTHKTYDSLTIVQDLFILSEDGLQTPLRIRGLEIPIANGQNVTVSYGDFVQGSHPVFLKNHSSGRTYPVFQTPLDLALGLGTVRSTFDIILLAIAACVALAVVGWLALGSPVWAVLAVLLFPVVVLGLLMRRKARMAAFRALLSAEEAAVNATRHAPSERA